MVAAAVTTGGVHLRLHLTDDAVWVGIGSMVTCAPNTLARDCIDRIDDRSMTVSGRPCATVEVLAGVLQRAIEGVCRENQPIKAATLSCPSHWGAGRRAVLESAARRTVREASAVPVALLAAAAQESERCVVVECASLTTTVTRIERGRDGRRRIAACELAPETGSADIREDGDRVAVIDRLIDAAGGDCTPDLVLLTGSVTADPELCSVITDRLDRPVLVVADAELVAASESADAADGILRDAPVAQSQAQLQARPDLTSTPRPRRRPKMLVASAVVVLILAGAAAVVWQVRADGAGPAAVPAPVQAVAEPPERFAMGRVSVQLPGTWRSRSGAGGRLDLVPDSGPDRRIVLVGKDIDQWIDTAAVAAALERRIAERGPGGPFSEFDPEARFAGRRGIAYTESPDGVSRVRWHVLVEDGMQVSVGCQFLEGDWGDLAADCEQALRSLEVSPRR
ncbi:type VII secretion-associated protein [Rhodococcus sp. ABRD24]|uniref:type VII secretion-associated protein n=1 Tax=Rhodococcus sp. ABRD24 TaxID=2507582 RepID=UPI00103B71D1|nr:type VII secretion-associated protein [Rhodococcus sp. ABRD24]QBJ95512.1 type VII secretion-associated protein [Rhodococcus sp. ABRD24]